MVDNSRFSYGLRRFHLARGRDGSLMRETVISAPRVKIWQSAALIVAMLALVVASNSFIGRIYPTFLSPLPLSLVSGFAIFLALTALPLFLLARFSFGYVVGLWMYVMVVGFIFLSYSTKLHYDHDQARISALASLITFLIPALFLRFQIPSFSITPRAMNALMICALIASAVVVIACAIYGFRIAGLYESLTMREEIARPRLLDYLSGIVSGAVLPFCFAYSALNRRWLLSAIAAILLLAFFPVLLNKTVLMAPAWLAFLLVLYAVFRPKTATALAIMVPTVVGLTGYSLLTHPSDLTPLGNINLRMIATPSIALDYYFAFFSTHPNTNFCQINFVRLFTECPYTEQLGVIMKREYDLGNFNGSLFTTEGIASVGPVLAPLATFVCGIIIGLGNLASSRLSPALVAVSSGILVQALTNVPLSTVLLSNGGAVLFLLWLISPPKSLT